MAYFEYIDSLLKFRPNKKFVGSELHHIVPKCLGGTNNKDNKVYLTPDEHFIAHKLLSEENPYNYDLVYALFRMCDGKHNVTPEDYGKIRVKMSEIYSNKFSGSGNPFYGKHHSNDTKQKLSDLAKERFRNESNAFLGKKHSYESKQKMSESHKKQVWIMLPDESQSKMIYRNDLQEYLDSGWVRGRPHSLFIGEKNPFYGKHHSQETKQEIKIKNMGAEKCVYTGLNSYNKICINCGTAFVANYAATKYCDTCRNIKKNKN